MLFFINLRVCYLDYLPCIAKRREKHKPMATLDEIRDEIRELEREIEGLEDSLNSPHVKESATDIEIIESLGNMDPLLCDILSETTNDDELNEDFEGRKIIKSKELQDLETTQIPKIQIENGYRFNGITVFPVSNDLKREFLGIRFDVFNKYLKKFSDCHYIILKKFEIEPERNDKIGSSNNREEWRWEVFQTTVPKYIPINDLARTYLDMILTESHFETEGTIIIPGFNRINKFAMRVYEHLSLLEYRRAIVSKLEDSYRDCGMVSIQYDVAVSRIKVVVQHQQQVQEVEVRFNPDGRTATAAPGGVISDVAVAVQRRVDLLLP